MLVYNYTTTEGQTAQIQVNLLDTPFVNEWKEYLKRTATRLPDILWKFSNHDIAKQYDCDPIPLLTGLRESFIFLQTNLGLDFSKEISDLAHLCETPADLSQSHLNVWHRHFTTIATEYYSGRMQIPEGITTAEMFTKFHTLNQNVHDLESLTYYKLSRRIPFGDKPQYSVFCADARALEGSNELWTTGHAENITETFDPTVSDYHYNVWLNEDIQGKDHMKAWLDEDDLTQTDVWGNSFMTPNVMFDPNMIYAGVLDNQEFKNDYVASGKPLNRWPLGTVANEVDWESLKPGRELKRPTITSIELDGVVLWEVK